MILQFLPHIIKAVPVWSLCILAFLLIPRTRNRLVGLGLLISGLGDIFLSLNIQNGFIYGLSCFWVVQLLYIAAFLQKPKLKKTRLVASIGIVCYCCVIAILVLPHVGNLLIPVVIYMLAITTMGVSASLGTKHHMIVLLGACLFILSDSLIAINRFLIPIPLSGYWILITYYIAQFLITFGSIKGQAARAEDQQATT